MRFDLWLAFAQGVSPASVAEAVFDECISDDPKQTQGLGGDNMTCVIVQFKYAENPGAFAK
eukprot:COSAG04_NODE_9_length_43480_cov_106.113806_32_plen_61_part_00